MLWRLVPRLEAPATSPRERRWVFVYSLVVMAATTVPYLIGVSLREPDWVFTGFVFGVDDGNSYIAKMMSGAYGAWLFRTPYTLTHQGGVLAFLPYIALGKLALRSDLHTSLVVLFHSFRVAAGLLMIWATYDFLSLFIAPGRARKWGLVLGTLGGGLGWLLVLMGRSTWLDSLPLEFYSPETFGFLALYGLPHLALARAGLLWGLGYYVGLPPRLDPSNGSTNRNQETLIEPSFPSQPKRNALILPGMAGLLWVIAGLAQPLTLAIGWLVLVAHLALLGLLQWSGRWTDPSRQRWAVSARKAAWLVGISSPLFLYNLLAFRSDPFLRAWTAQNLILSPHPAHYLLAYGLLIPLAVVGARRIWRLNPWTGSLPLVWALLLPALAYAPFNLQRRLPEGGWVALTVLAVAGLVALQPYKRPLHSVATVWSALVLPSTILLLGGGLIAIPRTGLPLFRPVDEVAAFQYLAENAKPGSAVLSAFETGNALPAWSPSRVVIGHGPESVGLEALAPRVAAFYQASTDSTERSAFLDDLEIDYVFWGPVERNLGAWDPAGDPRLQLAFDQGGYYVFKVVPE